MAALLIIEPPDSGSLALFYQTITLLLVLICIVWIFRVRSLARLRANIRRIYGLSEDVLSSSSAEEMQQRLSLALPGILGFRGARIWLEGHMGRVLDPAIAGTGEPPESALRCFRSGELVREQTPRRRLWLPMRSAQRAMGVLELQEGKRGLRLNFEEESALRHLANQVAIALQLIDQNALREQVLRNERLGAVGQLISGVASELHVPVARLAAELRELRESPETTGPALEQLSHLAEDASRTVSRLVAIGTSGQGPPQPVDVLALLRTLTEFRAKAWRLQAIEAEFKPPAEEVVILASPGQLEQAILSLFIHAEHALTQQSRRSLTLSAVRSAGQALIELTTTARAAGDSPSMHVVQEIIRNQGGSLRIRPQGDEVRFIIALPLTRHYNAAQPDQPRRVVSRSLTILLIEPDVTTRRALMETLSAEDHRVIPAQSGGEALDLAGRMAFDALFATSSLPDGKWVDMYEHARRLLPTFVLLHDGSAPAGLDRRDVLLLGKPVQPRELQRVLDTIADRIAPARTE